MWACEKHGVGSGVRRRIVDRLATVESDCAGTVLCACASDGRAWGFASPVSEYDVRFIHANIYLNVSD